MPHQQLFLLVSLISPWNFPANVIYPWNVRKTKSESSTWEILQKKKWHKSNSQKFRGFIISHRMKFQFWNPYEEGEEERPQIRFGWAILLQLHSGGSSWPTTHPPTSSPPSFFFLQSLPSRTRNSCCISLEGVLHGIIHHFVGNKM